MSYVKPLSEKNSITMVISPYEKVTTVFPVRYSKILNIKFDCDFKCNIRVRTDQHGHHEIEPNVTYRFPGVGETVFYNNNSNSLKYSIQNITGKSSEYTITAVSTTYYSPILMKFSSICDGGITKMVSEDDFETDLDDRTEHIQMAEDEESGTVMIRSYDENFYSCAKVGSVVRLELMHVKIDKSSRFTTTHLNVVLHVVEEEHILDHEDDGRISNNALASLLLFRVWQPGKSVERYYLVDAPNVLIE